jgi:hypothetical protein
LQFGHIVELSKSKNRGVKMAEAYPTYRMHGMDIPLSVVVDNPKEGTLQILIATMLGLGEYRS